MSKEQTKVMSPIRKIDRTLCSITPRGCFGTSRLWSYLNARRG
jgi:hypothetical protein